MIKLSELKSALEYLEFHGVESLSVGADYEVPEAVVIRGQTKDLFSITLYPEETGRESFLERTTTEKL